MDLRRVEYRSAYVRILVLIGAVGVRPGGRFRTEVSRMTGVCPRSGRGPDSWRRTRFCHPGTGTGKEAQSRRRRRRPAAVSALPLLFAIHRQSAALA